MDDGAATRPGVLARLRAATAGGPLGNRSFQLLSMGQLASTVGDLCYAVALPWFVLSSHGGPVELGTVLACYGVPRTALIPVGGVLADRLGPRVVMLAAGAARCPLPRSSSPGNTLQPGPASRSTLRARHPGAKPIRPGSRGPGEP